MGRFFVIIIAWKTESVGTATLRGRYLISLSAKGAADIIGGVKYVLVEPQQHGTKRMQYVD